MTDKAKGILALILCCLIWGISPLYYVELQALPALDVIAHRSLWSTLFFIALLLFQGQIQNLQTAFNSPQRITFQFATGSLIALNWLGFVYAISSGRALEASFGYYIYPLIAVFVGRFYFGEHLGPIKALSITLAAFAGLLLSFGLGITPWLAIGLAITFVFYGILKKNTHLNPIISVTAEILITLPFALFWLFQNTGFSYDWYTIALLAISGPLTAVPLILYSYAAPRVHFSTAGILFYLNPTFQFICAVAFLGEIFTFWHMLSFTLIWVAVVLYSIATYHQRA